MLFTAQIRGRLTCPPRKVTLDNGKPAHLLALQTHRIRWCKGERLARTTIHRVICTSLDSEPEVCTEVQVNGSLETLTFRYSNNKDIVTDYCIITSRISICRKPITKPPTPQPCSSKND